MKIATPNDIKTGFQVSEIEAACGMESPRHKEVCTITYRHPSGAWNMEKTLKLTRAQVSVLAKQLAEIDAHLLANARRSK